MLSEQKMKNAVKKISQKTNLPPHQVYGLFGLEQLLKKLSKTEYKDNFILKGGYLLASKYGLSNRATQDLDTTIQNLSLTRERIEKLADLITSPDEDGVQHFFLKGIRETREAFQYNGFNLKLIFQNGKSKIPMDIDLTTGEDLIAVNENEEIPLMFEEGTLRFPAYPVEQVLADKLYTMLAYGVDGTRMKDYYDLYALPKIAETIDYNLVYQSVMRTMKQRDLNVSVERFTEIVDDIHNSDFQRELWDRWRQQVPYASNISFDEVIAGVRQVAVTVAQIDSSQE